MNKKVYIVILNYNGWQDTIECLESVLKSNYPNYQIIVVDNNSPNNSMDYLIKWARGELCLWLPDSNPLKNLSFPLEEKPKEYIFYTKEEAIKGGIGEKEGSLGNPIVFIQAGENRGFSAGNNIGIKYALAKNDFKYIWLLNNDTVVEKNTLTNFVEYVNKEKVDMCGNILKYYDTKQLQAYGGKINKFLGTTSHIKDKQELENIDYIIGASMFLDKKFIKDIGLLPEEYFLYYEDVDYGYQAKIKGYKLGVCLDSVVYHKEGSSTQVYSHFIDCLYFKNKIRFYKKYLGSQLGLFVTIIISISKRLKKIKNLIKCFKGNF